MRIAEVMTRKVVTVAPGDSAEEARQALSRHGFRHLVVLDNKKLVGVLSDRDLRSGSRSLSRDAQVAELMSRPVVTVTPSTTVGEAANLMRLGRLSCLPVLERGELVGIVTSGDLLQLLAEEHDEAVGEKG